MESRRFFKVKHNRRYAEAGEKKVRLMGISISNFDDQETLIGRVCKFRQLPLPFKFPNAKDIRNDLKLW